MDVTVFFCNIQKQKSASNAGEAEETQIET